MNLQTVHHLIHAYKVAPWRVQRQGIGNVLLGVIALALVASLYLDVTAKAAIAGREIQELNAAILTSQQVSADLQTELAALTSAGTMAERALELGYRPVEPEEIEYLFVPGFHRPLPEILSSAALPQLSALTIPPEYTESLLDWIDERIARSARGLP
ncbi:MAG: hypothetical protein FJZ87_06810 [Chloroflexi bacterium]|nr:hypothetical protein [Chloroflexota bacterium]